jgi:tryptophan synthase alpha chain
VSGALETKLRGVRDAGSKCLVPYITGGVDGWLDAVRAAAFAGADAIEIGIPFSDPVMDGPIIQEASEKALVAGATPESILTELRHVEVDTPLAVMTYYNIGFHMGLDRFANRLATAGVVGAILPDLPLEESGPWCEAADAEGIETVMLAAPTSGDERLPLLCERSRGFVYGVGLLGVTGERRELQQSAVDIARRLKQVTDLPVLVGVGVSTPDQAREVAQIADGVVVGSAFMRQLLEAGPDQVGRLTGEFRAALDSV